MIRKFQKADIEPVMRIWLSANLDAHAFIPAEYWQSNFDPVRSQIAQAEVWVYELETGIQGFIGLAGDYIAGLFVDKSCRSRGIGKQLLDHVKQTHDALSLSVYKRNERAVSFYLREGFSLSSEQTDEATGEAEYTMLWSAQS